MENFGIKNNEIKKGDKNFLVQKYWEKQGGLKKEKDRIRIKKLGVRRGKEEEKR